MGPGTAPHALLFARCLRPSAGHYGVVRIGARMADGKSFAVKTIQKKRPLYVLMLVSDVLVCRSDRGCQPPRPNLRSEMRSASSKTLTTLTS